METYWDAYLNQLGEDDLCTLSTRALMEGFYCFLEKGGVLLSSGKGKEEVEELREEVERLKHENKRLREFCKPGRGSSVVAGF